MLAELSDCELLIEYASGFSDDAFSELHNRHAETIRRFIETCFRLDENDACDVMQNVWVAIAEGARNPISNFEGWIRTVAANYARRHVVRSARRIERTEQDHTQWPSDAPDPIDDLIYSENQEAIAERMRSLGPDRRAAIELIYTDRMTFADAAHKLGLSVRKLWEQVDYDAREILKIA